LDIVKDTCRRSKSSIRYCSKGTKDAPAASNSVTSSDDSTIKNRNHLNRGDKQQTYLSPTIKSLSQNKDLPCSSHIPNSDEKNKVTPRNKDKRLKDEEANSVPNTVEVMHAKLAKRLNNVDDNANETLASFNNSSSRSSLSPQLVNKHQEGSYDRCGLTTISDKKMLDTETRRKSCSLSHSSSPTVPLTAPKTWVCRYADYTSKYGLGFLMNNGSAGVLFNDATKIVVCPQNKFVRYIERISANSNVANEHTFLLENHPPSLHKKTTLLIHFRDFLIKDSNFARADDSDEPENLSVHPDLVYVKKWIRTEQALLFRLSNRSVQLLFSDKTELLLSSEARIVTYLDENNKRETFHLSSIMADEERVDVVKKLKYTKDVLHLLVHGKDSTLSSKSKATSSSTHRN